jgi:serine phosphatase RsbU (regulator of sigma subunit)
MKLSTRILLLVLGVALTTSALVIWVLNVNITRRETDRAHVAISAAIDRYVDRVSARHERVDFILRALLADPHTRSYFQGADEGDAAAINHLRDGVFQSEVRLELKEQGLVPDFHVLVNLSGQVLLTAATHDAELGRYLRTLSNPWPYDRVMEGDSGRLVRRHLATPRGLFLVLGVPLKAQLDQPPSHAYFVGLRVDDAWLAEQLPSAGERTPLLAWFMMGDRVVARAARGPAQAGSEFDAAVVRAPARQAPLETELSPPESTAFTVSGEDFVGQTFALGGTGNPPGRLLLASSLDDALEPLRELRRQIVLITLGAALFAVIGARAVSRLLSKPVEQMVAATQRIAAGQFDEPVGVQRNDELGVLARALNDMSQGLKERQRLREEKVKRDHDLDVARRIQMGVLPNELPVVPGYELASYALPAEQTGGDIFDVVALENDPTPAGPAIAILLADATGHGIGPAISVTQVRAMLRMGVRLRGSLRHVLHQMNRQLCDDLDPGRFVTALLGRLDPHAHRFDYDAAGQAPMLHYHAADRRVEWRDASQLPLGVADEPIEETVETMQLEVGDVVALLTDGFYEFMAPDRSMFDKGRVAELVAAHHCRPAREILDAILASVREFARGEPQLDDMTAVVIKRTG